MAANKHWAVVVKNSVTGKTKTVSIPGGLHEAEALRNSVFKAGGYGVNNPWKPLSAVLISK